MLSSTVFIYNSSVHFLNYKVSQFTIDKKKGRNHAHSRNSAYKWRQERYQKPQAQYMVSVV